jgi:predicted acyltransferase
MDTTRETPNIIGVEALPQPCVTTAVAQSSAQRMLSLDALRGFAMFWLIGGRELSLALAAIISPAAHDAFLTQVTHPRWEGFVAWDLVMPVFLFLVGTSIPFSLARRCELGLPLASTYWRIVRRVAVLWLLGWIAQLTKYNAQGMELYSNALQAIAVGYAAASVAVLHLRWKGQVILFSLLTLGYGAALMFVPFPGYSGGTLLENANLARYVDELLVGRYRHPHAFTWVLTSFGFAATVLLGAIAGQLLRLPLSERRRMAVLSLTGVCLMTVGWIWSYWLPLNRHLWTSTMILWAGGFSFLLVAAFHAVIDIAGYRRWSFPLAVIGANALLAYVLDPIFDWGGDALVRWFAPGTVAPYDDLLSAFCELTLLWALLWFLYQRRLLFRA